MKKIIIAFPGREYSGLFLINWSTTLMQLIKLGYTVTVVNEYSSFVTFSRMKTLGLNVLRGHDQKPFNGEKDYDIWITIDSDIYFTFEHIIELIKDTDTYPVVSGLYRMSDLKHYAVVEKWDIEHFKKHGTFKFLSVSDIDKDKKYIQVSYSGMGFFACRREVLEKLQYPYFSYPLIEMEAENGKMLKDVCSEDVAFCKNLTDAGYEIIVNTSLRVGHEKTLVI